MLLYEVRLEVASGERSRLERYMLDTHIAEVLATGCFESAEFAELEPGRFRTCYRAADREALDRYLRDFAPALRERMTEEFGTTFQASREVWRVVRRFP